jgi:hypothetical protein
MPEEGAHCLHLHDSYLTGHKIRLIPFFGCPFQVGFGQIHGNFPGLRPQHGPRNPYNKMVELFCLQKRSYLGPGDAVIKKTGIQVICQVDFEFQSLFLTSIHSFSSATDIDRDLVFRCLVRITMREASAYFPNDGYIRPARSCSVSSMVITTLFCVEPSSCISMRMEIPAGHDRRYGNSYLLFSGHFTQVPEHFHAASCGTW